MKTSQSQYQKIIDRILRVKLEELGFEEVKLKNCIKHEVLFRKDDIWFGTSWDERDQYLQLDLGHLYWMKDVIPRVIIAGDYSSFSNRVQSLKKVARARYLEDVANAVAASLEEALKKFNENPSLGDTKLSRLQSHILGRVADSDLVAYQA